MLNEKINARQLFALIMLFEFGTALVLPIGFVAQRDVWLSILLAMVGGVGLYWIYDYLYRQYPDLNLSGYIRRILGNYAGWPVSFLYLGFFIHNDSRILRETGELLVTSAYDMTPIFVINACFMLVVIFVVSKGVEVLARTGEIYLLHVLILGAAGTIMILASGIIRIHNLFPVLGDGWRPVLESAYRNILMFPFGETISFAAILPSLNKSSSGRKSGVLALLCSGIVLSGTHAMEVSVLGADIYGRSTFPLFLAVSKVNIMDFIQRMDGLVILTLIISAFFKCAITCYAAIVVAADLFRVKKPEKLALPVGIIILFNSMMTSNNWPEFGFKGKEVIMGRLLPFYAVAVPLALLVVHWIRRAFGPKRSA